MPGHNLAIASRFDDAVLEMIASVDAGFSYSGDFDDDRRQRFRAGDVSSLTVSRPIFLRQKRQLEPLHKAVALF